MSQVPRYRPDSLVTNITWRTYLMYLLPTLVDYQSSTTTVSQLSPSNQIIKTSSNYLSQCTYVYFYLHHNHLPDIVCTQLSPKVTTNIIQQTHLSQNYMAKTVLQHSPTSPHIQTRAIYYTITTNSSFEPTFT